MLLESGVFDDIQRDIRIVLASSEGSIFRGQWLTKVVEEEDVVRHSKSKDTLLRMPNLLILSKLRCCIVLDLLIRVDMFDREYCRIAKLLGQPGYCDILHMTAMETVDSERFVSPSV